jgi:predicted ribosome quality control (RQC) complex YloA/Tae2 family protein
MHYNPNGERLGWTDVDKAAISTNEVKRHQREHARHQEIKTAIELAMSPAAKCELRMQSIRHNIENARVDVERARGHLKSARDTLELYETQLRNERDKWRDIADTVHEQHK